MCSRDCGSEDGVVRVRTDRSLVAMEVKHERSNREGTVMKEKTKRGDRAEENEIQLLP